MSRRAKGLVSAIRVFGGSVALQGDALKATAPDGGWTPSLLDALRRLKPEIVELLREEQSGGPFEPAPSAVAVTCIKALAALGIRGNELAKYEGRLTTLVEDVGLGREVAELAAADEILFGDNWGTA